MADGDGGSGGSGGSGGETIPPGVQARIDTISAQRREALARVTQLETQLADANGKASKYDAAAAEIEKFRAKEAAWGDEKLIMGSGITDPEGVDFARVAWGRVPADQRPAGGLKEWLSKPDALPKAVRAYLPEQSSGQQTSGQQSGGQQGGGQGGGQGLPPSSRGAVQTTPGGQPAMTVEQIMSLSAEDYAKARTDLLTGKR